MFQTDLLGSVIGVTNSTGGMVDTITYDGFGNITSETSAANGGNLKFQGMFTDAATGQSGSGARQDEYNPATGSWTNPDPSGLSSGANPYEAMGNDPTNATDPSGLLPAIFEYKGLTIAFDPIQVSRISYFPLTHPKSGELLNYLQKYTPIGELDSHPILHPEINYLLESAYTIYQSANSKQAWQTGGYMGIYRADGSKLPGTSSVAEFENAIPAREEKQYTRNLRTITIPVLTKDNPKPQISKGKFVVGIYVYVTPPNSQWVTGTRLPKEIEALRKKAVLGVSTGMVKLGNDAAIFYKEATITLSNENNWRTENTVAQTLRLSAPIVNKGYRNACLLQRSLPREQVYRLAAQLT